MASPPPAQNHNNDLSSNGIPSLGFNASSRSGDENEEVGDNAIVAKRPRGRPPGSKNKPKPPQIVTVGMENGLASYVIEIAPGADVVTCLVNFTISKRAGISILHATGSVNGVISFRHSGPIRGYFDIVSFHGTISYPVRSLGQPNLAMMMTPTRSPGNLVGGIVAGRIIAAGPIIVTAGIFSGYTYHKLGYQE